MQSIVKQMLDEAQQAQENASGTGEAASAAASLEGRQASHQMPGPLPSAASSGPNAEWAGKYQKNQAVDYHSHTHKDWLPATVVNIDADGRIVIDLKPNTWISIDTQAHDVRPRRHSPYAPGNAAAAAGVPGVATPLRQRSPSNGIGSARGSTPGRAREFSPVQAQLGGRALTPGRIRESSPSYRYAGVGGAPVGGGGNGSRGPSPGPGMWRREPSQDRLARAANAVGAGGGSRAGSRASTPNRAASPRGGVFARRSDPIGPDQVRPPGMPQMPRVPSSPGQRYRMSPAAAAGMAIAGT